MEVAVRRATWFKSLNSLNQKSVKRIREFCEHEIERQTKIGQIFRSTSFECMRVRCNENLKETGNFFSTCFEKSFCLNTVVR